MEFQAHRIDQTNEMVKSEEKKGSKVEGKKKEERRKKKEMIEAKWSRKAGIYIGTLNYCFRVELELRIVGQRGRRDLGLGS